MRLFKKKIKPEPTDIVYEKWRTTFSIFQEHRFCPEISEGYTSKIEHGALKLELERKNLFAWTDNPLYRYEDFLLKADIGIDQGNGYSSAGFLFRRTDALGYYYFLVSNKAYYRFDLVLNGMPSVLVDWTPCPEFSPEKFNVIISAEGETISLYLNGSWLGNISDGSLSAGGISFAGQNYDENDKAVFTLNSIEIESRPAQMDSRRERLLPAEIPVEARLGFAQSRMRSGHYSAALIEIKRVLPYVSENAEAMMLAAECCIHLEMYTEAAALLEKVGGSGHSKRYHLQKAGLLYLMNDFFTLRTHLVDNMNILEDSPTAYNLLGNAEYHLGNWEKAAQAYKTAFEKDGTQALFAFNAARALQRCGQFEEAAAMYGTTGRLYFRSGEYEELAGILPFLEEMDRSNPETRILKAKLLFQNNDLKAAEKIFKSLIQENAADSTVWYLNALIETKNSRPKKAAESFKKAVELEPDYYLYQFKFAEYLYVNGGNYSEYLEKAVELAPDDPWVQNLSGQVMIERGDYESASAFFEKALSSAPDEDEIRVNYSEALFLSDRSDEALELLSGPGSDILNQRGNIYSRINDYKSAVEAYEAACTADRSRLDIMLNLAAACIETDAFSRAEELLVRVLDYDDNAQAYNLMGTLALLKGESGRAEAAYTKAVAVDPGYVDAVCNLAELYINRERLNDADILLGGLRSENPGERFNSLKKTVFRKRMDVHHCSSCGEEWIVPKKLSEQPALQLVGEPPDEMPAGKCSNCGKSYCIGCTREHILDGRLVCLDCGSRLKLSENWMRYLYHRKDYR